MPRGRFITFEGGEGVGKTTQCARLVRHLHGRGRGVVATREPGGTPWAEALRALLLNGPAEGRDAMAETLAHYAARRSHMEKAIEPALARGDWVVCDRFADSTMAYQGCAMGVGRAAVERLHREALGERRPDLTLILDLPPAEGLARVRGRDLLSDRYQERETAFHDAVREAFLEIGEAQPERCIVIDARDDMDGVAAAVARAVAERLDG